MRPPTIDFGLRTARAAQDGAAPATAASQAIRVIGRLIPFLDIWFWAIIGLPALIAGIYYFAVASDLYYSEVKFKVQGASTRSGAELALPRKVAGIVGALGSPETPDVSEETYAVNEYISSRDAVRRLELEIGLRTLLNRPEGDLITRFPGAWFWRTDFEALYKIYANFVSVEFPGNGVSTLRVSAYRPEDAQLIASALLEFSEQFVNQLNERANQDSIAALERELTRMQQKIEGIQTELTAYRVKQKLLDPETAAAGPLRLLNEMNAMRANAEAQLAEIIQNSPNSPQVQLIRIRIASLGKLIAEERTKLTGDNDSVAAALVEYERLNVQRLLAQKNFASIYTSLQDARRDAHRQSLFLVTIVQPTISDYPIYPRRFLRFGIVILGCLLMYGLAWLFVPTSRKQQHV